MGNILTKSNVIRNRHLQENLGLYRGYDNISNDLSYYTFRLHPLKRITEDNLYMYTHSETTEYSKMIGHQYFKHRNDFIPYINVEPINPQNFWGGEFHDYYDYVNTVYGQITPPIQFIEGLLSTQFLDEAIRVTSPAIVHNPEPTLSMNGVIKTNVNNFSGTDTRLGLIGNQMYAHALYHGANFNTLRKNTPSFVENNITPTVGVRFGNSTYTLNSLSSIVSAIREDGRIVEDYNGGIKIYHDLSELYSDIVIQKTKRLSRKVRKELGIKYKDRFRDDGTETYEDVFVADINPTNLFQTLQFNPQRFVFDENGKVSIQTYAGTTFGADDKAIINNSQFNTNLRGKINDVTQQIWYDDGGIGFAENFQPSEFDNYENIFNTLKYVTNSEGKKRLKVSREYDNLSTDSLLDKTNELFKQKKIGNLGFGQLVDYTPENTTTDSSTSTHGWRSRGRNLEKKGAKQSVFKYSNPFCRAWAYHNQYSKMSNLIRPISNNSGYTLMTIEETQALNKNYRAWNKSFNKQTSGDKYLAENTVLNDNGMVNIAPSTEGKVDIKKCMFSIENLAWKDVLNKEIYLSKEQRGPNGGRIMWFPPYDLNFSENTNVNWEQSTFIGRGEKMYTYSNTDRTGSLSFTILIDHPSTIHNIYTEGGNVREGITDDDILRFFAGCEPIDIPVIKEKPPKEYKTPKTPETELTTKTVTVYVYFPNNYSGHYTNTIKSLKDDTTTPPDDDFIKYMLYGVNASSDVFGSGETRGYEMCDNGLSITTITGTTLEKSTFLNCKPRAIPYNECTKPGNKRFYYRTDFDLKQNLSAKNCQDSSSYKLNSINGDGDFNFTEFVSVILGNNTKDKTELNNYMKKIFNDEAKFKVYEENCKKLNEILSNGDNITKIRLNGSATKQDSKNSKMLAKRRGGTLKYLLEQAFPNLKSKIEIGTHNIKGSGNEINSEKIKKNRYSRIEIEYQTAKTENMSEGVEVTKHKKVEKEDKSKQVVTNTKEYIRYENEAQYFSNLKDTDPLVFRKLTDKFKYFTPAFHAISPEGFNARLTFLQQCTRQGHTIESKTNKTTLDKPTEIAGNLAFGRMPVCVLRIGDFIYSRILITSMSINYGDNQWDLNPEGIGVQPMLAKVSLGITILGGQSLEGPISKLQNAITFNHYANAGVYDDRADRAKPVGDSNKWSTDYYYTWEPKDNNGTKK